MHHTVVWGALLRNANVLRVYFGICGPRTIGEYLLRWRAGALRRCAFGRSPERGEPSYVVLEAGCLSARTRWSEVRLWRCYSTMTIQIPPKASGTSRKPTRRVPAG